MTQSEMTNHPISVCTLTRSPVPICNLEASAFDMRSGFLWEISKSHLALLLREWMSVGNR